MDIDLSDLTPGQRLVVTTLLEPKMNVPTYSQVSQKLGISLGTLYRQLKRVRDKHPVIYHEVMKLRKEQLAQRHQRALKDAARHSQKYFRRKYNREYKQKYGFYPWERRGLIGRRGKA